MEARDRGLVIESRCYQTVMGPWYYYTMNDGQIDLEAGSYLLIGTLESLLSLQAVFGKERVVPIYVELDDGERLLRGLNRERAMKTPRYDELCRRYLGDEKDFSPEKIEEAGIRDRFDNTDLEACLGRIRTQYLAAG